MPSRRDSRVCPPCCSAAQSKRVPRVFLTENPAPPIGDSDCEPGGFGAPTAPGNGPHVISSGKIFPPRAAKARRWEVFQLRRSGAKDVTVGQAGEGFWLRGVATQGKKLAAQTKAGLNENPIDIPIKGKKREI